MRSYLSILPLSLLLATTAAAQSPSTSPRNSRSASERGAQSPSPLTEPQTGADAVETGRQAYHAARGGHWWHFSALVIMVVMWTLKAMGVLKAMGRWRYVVVPLLALLASLLSAFQGGASVDVAASVLTTGLATGKIQELWEHGIRGKPHGSTA